MFCVKTGDRVIALGSASGKMSMKAQKEFDSDLRSHRHGECERYLCIISEVPPLVIQLEKFYGVFTSPNLHSLRPSLLGLLDGDLTYLTDGNLLLYSSCCMFAYFTLIVVASLTAG